MIESHLQKIREHPIYRDAHIFVFIEANYGGLYNTGNIAKVCEQKKFMPIMACSFDETSEDRVGVWVKPDIKPQMCAELQRSLADGQLCFADKFVTTRKDSTTDGRPGVQNEFYQQLGEYREEIREPTDLDVGTFRKHMTGKSSGKRDDMCMSLQIALYFGLKKRLDPDFREAAETHGWSI